MLLNSAYQPLKLFNYIFIFKCPGMFFWLQPKSTISIKNFKEIENTALVFQRAPQDVMRTLLHWFLKFRQLLTSFLCHYYFNGVADCRHRTLGGQKNDTQLLESFVMAIQREEVLWYQLHIWAECKWSLVSSINRHLHNFAHIHATVPFFRTIPCPRAGFSIIKTLFLYSIYIHSRHCLV